ncbi:oxidoreductase [Paenibacillus pini]|uniref:Oxidoreductase n=1 Tax=Paenibacillus pini JCM 16418 TaxID=1236976 RepID=W7Z583_9BACL|nr:oxidoreductase [Paenibacillus pini]GAF09484.1 oxidoreductase [Paenibacillus pini JCM 16418]
MGYQALVLGATGLVGEQVVHELLEHDAYSCVKVLVRRPLEISHPKLLQQIADWDRLDEQEAFFEGVEDVFCCLGTTIRKAGSRENFRRVDFEYPLAAARLAQKQGVRQFLIVTAMGANASSRIFYNRTKGEIEDALTIAGLKGLHLFRPSMLLGYRPKKRFVEDLGGRMMKVLDPIMTGSAAKYKAIPAETVARAMVNIALTCVPGVHVYPNDVIHALGAPA